MERRTRWLSRKNEYLQVWEGETRKRPAAKEVAMKEMTTFVLDSERAITCPELEKSLLIKPSEELPSCWSQKTTSSRQIMDRFLKSIPPADLRFVFNIGKATVKYYCRERSEVIPFISALRTNWRR